MVPYGLCRADCPAASNCERHTDADVPYWRFGLFQPTDQNACGFYLPRMASGTRGKAAKLIVVDEFAGRPPCACGQPVEQGEPVCATCIKDLRDLTHPSSKDAVLHLIADIGEGSTSINSLSHIARLARHGLTLKG